MKKGFSWLSRIRLVALVGLVLAASLTLGGCGSSDGYDAPQSVVTNASLEGHATNVLIEADTLKGWMDQGLVNADSSFDGKVVILDYAGTSDRIPGAGRVAAGELNGVRLDGLAPAASMVATGEQMDVIIQRLGIDENTTIVFTTDAAAYNSTRAYWTFRYWGFPRERLKLLNGGNAAWKTAGYELTSIAPELVSSTYSVKNLGSLNSDLRVSISELLARLADTSVTNGVDYLTVDARGGANPSGYYGNAATGSLIDSTKSVVFEGRPDGGIALGQATLFINGKFKTPTEIEALFTTAFPAWTPELPIITYCTSGYSCTPVYFALEAILGAPVQVFDGSWSQAGQYAAIVTDANNDKVDDVTGAALPNGSVWDLSQYVVTGDYASPVFAPGYNVNNGKALTAIYKIPYSPSVEASYAPGAIETNQVETTDENYIATPPVAAPPTATGGGSAAGC